MKFKNKKGRISAFAALIAAVLLFSAAVFGAFGSLFGSSADAGKDNCAVSTGSQLTASAYSPEVFYFDSVRFEANVNKDKTLDVTETLVARWTVTGKTGLIRDIQRQSKTTRYVNGKKISGKNYFAKISDISATLDGDDCDWHILPKNDDFYNADFFSIEMKHADGSELKFNQPYTFVLKYRYDMGDDRLKAFDDLTFDIFGYEMNRTEAFAAKLTFPEDVTLESGNVTARSAIGGVFEPWTPIEGHEKFAVNGNAVEIETEMRARGLTLQVILPKGTFTGGVTLFWYYWAFVAAAVAAVIAVAVLFVKNLPQKPVETVEFYPPEDLSVMHFSAIWHKAVKSKDAAALILKWADMGLITISKAAGSNLILRRNTEYDKDYVLPENVSYSDDVAEIVSLSGKKYFDNNAEREYFNTLFSGIGGSNAEFSTFSFGISGESEKKKLYDATQNLIRSVKLEKIIKPVNKTRKLIPFLGLLPTLALIAYNCIIGSTFMPLFFFIFMAAGTFAGGSCVKEDGTLLSPLIIIFPVMFFAMPYFCFVWLFAMPLYDYAFLLYIAPVIYVVCMFVLPFFIGRRTEDANKVYGRILGFKRFLLTAELPRIQLLFDENPNYFSDILPWCMIMDISDKVEKRFAALEKINMPKVLEDNIDMHSLRRTLYYSSMLGAPRSSGGGGGSSFGGGGGGRGGSFGGGGGGGGSRSR